MNIDIDDFLKLRETLPIVDVRSEKEYAEGHIMHAINIPILNNDERAAVGTDYKRKGQLEAIKTGFRLVGPRIIDLVTQAERVAGQGEILVHCWRGGMRSANFCHFLGMAKIPTHQLRGGYKTYRNKVLESFTSPFKFLVIGGSTGSGKSDILRALALQGEQVLDLEKLANHRGSAFGGLMMPEQPSTEQFQNNLFEEILKLDLAKPIWIEDESLNIGKIFIPEELWRTMNDSPIIELLVDKDVRIKRLVDDYGPADRNKFLESMERVTKKLGGQNFQKAKEKLLEGDIATTIDILLTYYDKAYAAGLAKKQNRVKQKLAWDGGSVTNFALELISSVTPQTLIQ